MWSWRCDWRISRGGLGLQRSETLAQNVIVGIVAELVCLSEALVASGGRAVARHALWL